MLKSRSTRRSLGCQKEGNSFMYTYTDDSQKIKCPKEKEEKNRNFT